MARQEVYLRDYDETGKPTGKAKNHSSHLGDRENENRHLSLHKQKADQRKQGQNNSDSCTYQSKDAMVKPARAESLPGNCTSHTRVSIPICNGVMPARYSLTLLTLEGVGEEWAPLMGRTETDGA